jgi:hypothetical protein
MLEGTEGYLVRNRRAALAAVKRPWLLTIVLASALCVAYLIGVFVNWGQAADRSLYANLGMIPIGLVATILAWGASRTQTDRRSQWAWRLLSVGLGCFFAGDLLFFILENVLGRSPFPSVADIGYLAYYPLVLAGLLCFPSAIRDRVQRATFYLDCFIVVLAGGIVISYFFLIPTLHSASDNVLAYSLSVGYPIGDILLLTGIAYLLLRRLPRQPLGILLLGIGLLVGLAADVIYGYQSIQGTSQAGGISDAAYMLSWALFAWAGYSESLRAGTKVVVARKRDFSWAERLLPHGFILIGVGMILYVNRSLLSSDVGFVIAAAGALIVTAVARQVLIVWETSRLHAAAATCEACPQTGAAAPGAVGEVRTSTEST